MKTKLTYAEKLRDPRWQKKRLEVMQTADFKCQDCGDHAKTLNVHHVIYKKNANPWDYPNELLKCLCETCHEDRHRLMLSIQVTLSTATPSELMAIHESILPFIANHSFEDVAFLCDYWANNFADYWNTVTAFRAKSEGEIVGASKK